MEVSDEYFPHPQRKQECGLEASIGPFNRVNRFMDGLLLLTSGNICKPLFPKTALRDIRSDRICQRAVCQTVLQKSDQLWDKRGLLVNRASGSAFELATALL